MKKIIGLLLVALVGLSLAVSSAYAFGDCAGKDKRGGKNITHSEETKTSTG